MALSKLEAKDWLKELGFSAEKVEQLAAEFTAAQMTKIAEGYARQSDYDRAFNANKAEIERQQADLAAANQRLNEEMAAFAVMQQEGGQITQKMRDDLDKAQQQALKLKQKLERVATDAGMDVTAVLKDVDVQVVQPTTTPQTPAFDASKFVSADDYQRSVAQLANMALTLPAELQQIQYEHQQLFGKQIDTREIVAELQKRASTRGNTKSLDPRAVWEELHGVPAARTAADQKRFDDAIAAAKAQGAQEALSQASIPGATHVPGKPTSPVLGTRQSALNRPQPGTTASNAAAAFRSGKYRTAEKTTA